MSMNSSFIYGYGFPCDCKDETLIDFIHTHKEAFCLSETEQALYQKLLEETTKNLDLDLENFFATYKCDVTGLEGLGAVIANIISRETGVRFIYCPSDNACDTPRSVVFEVSYPWQLNHIERELTEDQLTAICKAYMQELDIEEEPDYLALEYFG